MRLLKQLSKCFLIKVTALVLFVLSNLNARCQLNPGYGAVFQPSKKAIIKFRIAQLRIQDSSSGYFWQYYFDSEGNDTAMYANGKPSWSKKYVKNKQGKIIKYHQTDSNRVVEYAAEYKHAKDGSYVINITDQKYKLAIHSGTYDKLGRIQKEFLMDGGRHNYKYDSLGRLSRIDSESGLDGYDQYTAEFSYDPGGKLILLKMDVYPLQYETVDKYYYDDKDLLIKSQQTVLYKYDHGKNFYTTIYSYVFR